MVQNDPADHGFFLVSLEMVLRTLGILIPCAVVVAVVSVDHLVAVFGCGGCSLVGVVVVVVLGRHQGIVPVPKRVGQPV